MSSRKRSQSNRKDMKARIIERQNADIDNLKEKIAKLEISCDDKDNLIHSIDSLREELVDIVDEIKKKSEEYDKLRDELLEMRNAMNQIVFKNKWRIVKWLLR